MNNEDVVLLCPLIGLETEIVSSSSKESVGIRGKTIDETKNMVFIESKEKVRKVSKKGNVFEVLIKGKKIKVRGDDILFRPEEKAKNIRLSRSKGE